MLGNSRFVYNFFSFSWFEILLGGGYFIHWAMYYYLEWVSDTLVWDPCDFPMLGSFVLRQFIHTCSYGIP